MTYDSTLIPTAPAQAQAQPQPDPVNIDWLIDCLFLLCYFYFTDAKSNSKEIKLLIIVIE
jgi:hypothetical protein